MTAVVPLSPKFEHVYIPSAIPLPVRSDNSSTANALIIAAESLPMKRRCKAPKTSYFYKHYHESVLLSGPQVVGGTIARLLCWALTLYNLFVEEGRELSASKSLRK